MAQYKIIDISKEGSVISIKVDTKERPITINCTTKKITSYTGREVKYFPSTVYIDNNLSYGQKWALKVIQNWVKYQFVDEFKQVELFIANLDLISGNYLIPYECPKGYIKWLRDNGKEISNRTLEEFRNLAFIKSLTTEDKEIVEKMKEVLREDDHILKWYISIEDKELRKRFNQILKTSAKKFDWSLLNSMTTWYVSFIREKLGERAYGDEWIEHLDGNRDFRYNIKTFEYVRDKERNEKILANEKKIKDIEKFSDEHFTIIVPSNIDEFTEEGKMQHNCVGSYYHDSMAEGNNLIYFIRLTSNPQHSFITNRFNVSCGETVESRIVNNDINRNAMALELIKKIDEKIKELLSIE